jgi:putative transposase
LSFIRIGAVSIADCGHEFQSALKGYEIKSSMSRKGNCWDTQSKIFLSAAFGLTRAGTGDMPLR